MATSMTKAEITTTNIITLMISTIATTSFPIGTNTIVIVRPTTYVSPMTNTTTTTTTTGTTTMIYGSNSNFNS